MKFVHTTNIYDICNIGSAHRAGRKGFRGSGTKASNEEIAILGLTQGGGTTRPPRNRVHVHDPSHHDGVSVSFPSHLQIVSVPVPRPTASGMAKPRRHA
jgi:hypothetical protein